MSLIKEKFNASAPLPSIFPDEWKDTFTGSDNILFDNLDQFVFVVSQLTQEEDDYCGISYAEALRKLIIKESDFPESEQESIRNLVRKNLLKRGLITEEIYENFKYTSDGTNLGFDVGKYSAGEPDCILTPSREYIDFFYELYVNVTYPYTVSNEDVRNNVAKLLATVEELERKHVFIKINTVVSIRSIANVDNKDRNFFSLIPVFSHKDRKSVSTMSAVINDRLLRKFYFAVTEDFYGEDIYSCKGYPEKLEKTMNIGESFDEIEMFETIMEEVGAS